MTGLRVVAAISCLVVAAGCGGQPRQHAVDRPSVTASPSPSVTATPSDTPSPSQTVTPSSTPPTTGLPGWLAGGVVTRLPTNRRVVALTFDGGAGAQGAASILGTLRAERVPATFFLTGQFVADNPSLVGAIAESGYLLGNHTTTHPHLNALSSAAISGEIVTAAERLRSITGVSPRPWFRFPFGEHDARTVQLVHELGYGAIGWTVDTRGWQGRKGGTAAAVVARVKAALQPGAIVLMHLGAHPSDGTTYDADELPAVIAMVRAAGYGFVDLRYDA